MIDENTILADGNLARLVLSNLSPILDSIKLEAQARFMNEFKLGSLDATKSLAYAAELRILEDIENRLKAQINRAERISRVRDNARNSDDDDTNA